MHTVRLYHCARCRDQVIVCSHCDRGQIYCAGHCAQIARRESRQRAAQRYRQTVRGKLKQALRQRRYRQLKRQQQKVTHHCSAPKPPCDLLPPAIKKIRRAGALAKDQEISCHFCGQSGWIFIRNGFLRHFPRLRAFAQQQGPPGCC